ncbi:MAG TPA: cytochrome c3 family protein [Candidatus Angelobacter sp.]
MAEQPPLRKARTAKTLGARYNLNYFKGFSPFRLWRLGLCIGLLVLALAWIGAESVTKSRTIYSAGPLSSAHSVFAQHCELCHATLVNGVRKVGTFWQDATDQACRACHAAPDHQLEGKQPNPPSCASCHLEHRGLVHLVRVEDQQCLNCHADLKRVKGDTRFASSIRGFKTDLHPEFSALLNRMSKPPAITFHHGRHMGKALKTLEGKQVTLACSDCHRPVAAADHSPWKYRRAGIPWGETPMPQYGGPVHPDARRELMTMPEYEKQCAGCHDLKFDDLVTASLVHPKSQEDVAGLSAGLEQRFKDYIQQNPKKIYEPDPPDFKIPEAGISAKPVNAGEWVQRRVAHARRFLWNATCKYCHELDFPPEQPGLPLVKKPDFKSRQMDDAIFSHEAHIAVTCESCHEFSHVDNLAEPEKLLPGIKTCATCHSGYPARDGKAENRCFLCHQYHKWDPQRETFPSTYTIPELTGQ